MAISSVELVELAKSAIVPRRKVTPSEPWLPVVDVLRRKGMSWSAIYDWLKEQGENVQERKGTFISTMSRRYRSWLDRRTKPEASNR